MVGHDAVLDAPAELKPEPVPQSNANENPAAVSTDDGSDGEVSDNPIAEPSSTAAGELNVADGATLLTAAEARYSVLPPSLSKISPLTVRLPLSSVEHEAVLVELAEPNPAPSPQSNAYENPAAVSTDDGSDGEVSDNPIAEPSSTAAGELNVADGATLLTVTVAE